MPPLFFSMVPGCPDCRDRYAHIVELMRIFNEKPIIIPPLTPYKEPDIPFGGLKRR